MRESLHYSRVSACGHESLPPIRVSACGHEVFPRSWRDHGVLSPDKDDVTLPNLGGAAIGICHDPLANFRNIFTHGGQIAQIKPPPVGTTFSNTPPCWMGFDQAAVGSISPICMPIWIERRAELLARAHETLTRQFSQLRGKC